jgi:hypothetical protein
MAESKIHDCLHEKDFGILFTKIDMMTEAIKSQTITNDALKVAIDASLKYIHSMEAINSDKKTKKEMTLQRSIFYSSTILGICGIITALIIAFV